MFLGLRTVLYAAPDLEQGKAWYTSLLGEPPYFDAPYYVGYNVGGYELGLVPDAPAPDPQAPAGVVTYWGVTDADAAYANLLALGATPHAAVQDVGEGIRVASVLDPFGNIVGIIENPHFALPAEA